MVNRNEIKEEAHRREVQAEHWFWKAISPPLLMAIIVNAVVVYTGYVRMSEQVSTLREEVSEMQKLSITPGAQTAIAEIKVFDAAVDRRLTNVENTMIAQRTEMMGYLQRIDQNVQTHINGQLKGH